MDRQPGGREAAEAGARREDPEEHRRLPVVPLLERVWAYGTLPHKPVRPPRGGGVGRELVCCCLKSVDRTPLFFFHRRVLPCRSFAREGDHPTEIEVYTVSPSSSVLVVTRSKLRLRIAATAIP